MSITDKLRQYHKQSAERIRKYAQDLLDKMDKGEEPEIKVAVRLPRGEAINTINRKTCTPLAKHFPNIYQWLKGKAGEIKQYDIEAIKQDSEYRLASDYFNFLPTLIAQDRYGFVWENERDYASLEQAYAWFEKFLSDWPEKYGLNSKQQISIESFVKKASFGPIRLNMSKTEIERVFGPPDYYYNPLIFGYKKATIWKYGEMEFQFNPDSERLTAIDNNDLQYHQSFASESRSFELTDLFFFKGEKPLAQRELEKKLLDINLKFHYFKSVDWDAIKISLENGIEIIFEAEEDGSYSPTTVLLAESSGANQFWTPMSGN